MYNPSPVKTKKTQMSKASTMYGSIYIINDVEAQRLIPPPLALRGRDKSTPDLNKPLPTFPRLKLAIDRSFNWADVEEGSSEGSSEGSPSLRAPQRQGSLKAVPRQLRRTWA